MGWTGVQVKRIKPRIIGYTVTLPNGNVYQYIREHESIARTLATVQGGVCEPVLVTGRVA